MRTLVLARPRSTSRPISRRTAVATAGETPVRATPPASRATRTGAVSGPTGPCATAHGAADRRTGQ
eukprot:9967761-Alexandrium_andersonii.AAC.1